VGHNAMGLEEADAVGHDTMEPGIGLEVLCRILLVWAPLS
jgi:hypothetical protein